PSEAIEYAMGLGKLVGIPPDDFAKMTAAQLVEELFEADHVRRTMFMGAALNVLGSALAPGQGAFTVLCGFFALLPVGAYVGGMHTLPHALSQVFVKHGGVTLRNCPGERIIVEDGEARGVQLGPNAAFPGAVILAYKALVSGVGAGATVGLVGEDVVQAVDPVLATTRRWGGGRYRGAG